MIAVYWVAAQLINLNPFGSGLLLIVDMVTFLIRSCMIKHNIYSVNKNVSLQKLFFSLISYEYVSHRMENMFVIFQSITFMLN